MSSCFQQEETVQDDTRISCLIVWQGHELLISAIKKIFLRNQLYSALSRLSCFGEANSADGLLLPIPVVVL